MLCLREQQTLLTVLQILDLSVFSSCGWMYNGWWCCHKNSDANFSGGAKMNSDAVDTWFGDLVLIQKNCSFAAAKLPCRSWLNHVANSVLNTLQWGIIEHVPEVTKNDVKTTIWGWRFLAKDKSEESSCHCHPALSTFLGTCVSDLCTTRKHVLRE